MKTISNPLVKGQKIRFTTEWKKTYTGFCHIVTTDDGVTCKTNYINRTWEVYPFQTALHRCIEKWLKEKTGLNPKTKRDHDAFFSLYEKMTKELDGKETY